MQAVYTTTFISQRGLTGTYSYLVPSGKIAVLTWVAMYVSSTAAGSITLRGPAGEAVYWQSWGINDQKNDIREIRCAYSAGQSIVAVANVGPIDAVDVTATGFLLTAQ